MIGDQYRVETTPLRCDEILIELKRCDDSDRTVGDYLADYHERRAGDDSGDDEP